MQDCLFCKIERGDIPATKVYQDEHVIAIKDIEPQAPFHFLIIPAKHVATLNDLTESDNALVGHMHQIAKQLAQQHGFAETGYRTLFNCNRGGGQAVFHLHLHVLGGRQMSWPPG